MRFSPKLIATAALAAVSLALGGCVYDDYGYGGVNVGYGAVGGYDDGYYGYPGGAYGFGGAGYGAGWYNDFYYPGTGYYVFDRAGRRSRWNDGQRRYWQRRQAYRDGRYDGRYDGRRDFRRDDRGVVSPGGGLRDRFRPDRRGDRPGFDPDRRPGGPRFGNDGVGRPGPRPDIGQGGGRPAPRPDMGQGGGRRGDGLIGRVQRRIERQQ